MKTVLIVLGSIGLVLCAFASALPTLPLIHPAQAAEVKTEQRKLVGTSWHCWTTYPCELWYLTRPAMPGEQAEKIVIQGEEKPFDEAAEPKPPKLRGDISIPSEWKLVGANWKCGSNGCEVSFQLRKSRKGEPAQSYLFHNGKEYYNFRETP